MSKLSCAITNGIVFPYHLNLMLCRIVEQADLEALDMLHFQHLKVQRYYNFVLLACFIHLLMGIVPIVMVQKALAARHTINGRELEVKVATPKVYIVSL